MSKKTVIFTIRDEQGNESFYREELNLSDEVTNWTLYLYILGSLKNFEDSGKRSS